MKSDGIIDDITPEERAQILAGVTAEMQYWAAAPARFFRAWKEAARLAGAVYFGDGTPANLQNATTLNQLAPNLERCTEAMGYLSGGEKAFLAVLYSFYNDVTGQKLMAAANVKGMADIASSLDLQRRRLVSELLLSYTGW